MAIWGIPAFALIGTARLIYEVLDKRGWLPARAYRQKAIGRFKDNDLPGAEFYCRLALDRNPQDSGALVLEDLFAMRRDALRGQLLKRLTHEYKVCTHLEHTHDEYGHRYRRSLSVLKRWQLWPQGGVALWLVTNVGMAIWLPVSPFWVIGAGIVGLLFFYWIIVHGALAKRIGGQEVKVGSLKSEIESLNRQLRIQRSVILEIQNELDLLAQVGCR
ncbi:hypothetical protein JW992_14835 [candidate division KSB1 bacterium]|nr:hypothetical protein [candidate division KSB1 bacterium]